jgi:hypothetical protein
MMFARVSRAVIALALLSGSTLIVAGPVPAPGAANPYGNGNTSFNNPYAPGGPYDPHRFDYGGSQQGATTASAMGAAGKRRWSTSAGSTVGGTAHSALTAKAGTSTLSSLRGSSVGMSGGIPKRSLVASQGLGQTAQGISNGELNRLASKNQTMAGDKGCLSAQGSGTSTIGAPKIATRCH